MGLAEPGYILLFGRLHPLVLHFPVALLIVAAVLEFLPKITKTNYGNGYNIALWIVLCLGALSAVVAASMGLTLASTGSYGGEMVYWHMRFGLSVAGFSVVAVLLKVFAAEKSSKLLSRLYSVSLIACVFAIFMAGHYGGALTHGSEFLPSAAPEPIASWLRGGETATVKRVSNDHYSTAIKPIIDEHCASCHGVDKQEGGLRFDDPELVLIGGESGLPTIVPGKALSSEMVRRLFLNREDKKAMPPDGRARPADRDLVIIMDWIEAGAPWQGETIGPTPLMADSLSVNAVPASLDALDALDTAGVTYFPMNEDNPLLNVDMSLKAYDNEMIKRLLEPIKNQVSWLNVAGNTLDDDTVELIASFANLTRLSLARTNIDDDKVGAFEGHTTLTSLNLTGNPITLELADEFNSMTSLQTLYIWGTAIEGDDLLRLRDILDGVTVLSGAELIKGPAVASETE